MWKMWEWYGQAKLFLWICVVLPKRAKSSSEIYSRIENNINHFYLNYENEPLWYYRCRKMFIYFRCIKLKCNTQQHLEIVWRRQPVTHCYSQVYPPITELPNVVEISKKIQYVTENSWRHNEVLKTLYKGRVIRRRKSHPARLITLRLSVQIRPFVFHHTPMPE